MAASRSFLLWRVLGRRGVAGWQLRGEKWRVLEGTSCGKGNVAQPHDAVMRRSAFLENACGFEVGCLCRKVVFEETHEGLRWGVHAGKCFSGKRMKAGCERVMR